jgi:hypothetical protein
MYPLSETREAFRHLVQDHGRGKVAIIVDRAQKDDGL